MAKDQNKSRKKKGGEVGQRSAITTDERFSSVHNDPRFKLPNLNKMKVKVDDRFKQEDMVGFKKNKTKYDRYGRLLKEDDRTSTFDKLYQQESASEKEDDSEEQSAKLKSASSSEAESESESAAESESESESASGSDFEAEPDSSEVDAKDSTIEVLDRARGEGISSDSDSSESDEDSESDEEEVEEESEIEIEETKPEEGEPERRFAVVNLDWDNVTSTDLFAAFTSFLPPKGEIKNVSIYPSEYGKERMQKEEIEGPPRDLFKSKKKATRDDSDDESDSDIEDIAEAAKKLYEEGNGEDDYDSKALRRYQLQRLRYYYAVVTCDSIATAKAIYDNCDGSEFESSANIFDLRYIPDDMDFEDSPRDFCNQIASTYKPSTFVTDALQSSKAKLTWDETPVERAKISTKAFSQREIEDMDFQAYLASDSEDEEEHNIDLRNKYKSLVASSTRIGDKDLFSTDKAPEDGEVDMEITFTPGLSEQSADAGKAKEAKGEEEETTMDRYMKKERERKKKRKDKLKQAQEEEKARKKEAKEQMSSKKTKGKKYEDDTVEDATLALLADDGQENHFSMKDIIKREKEKAKGKHKKKSKTQAEIVEDDFKPDLSDPRFREIFENHEFAIDPTLPNFKKTETMKQILAERQKRKPATQNDEVSSKKKKARK